MEYSILIKTFERRKSLWNLIESIQKFHPEAFVLIADDSFNHYKEETLQKFSNKNIQYYTLTPDVGISVGRNFLLSKVNTEYFVLCDDDFVFYKSFDFNRYFKYMRENNVDIYGGYFLNFSSLNFKISNLKRPLRLIKKIKKSLLEKPVKKYFVGYFYESNRTLIQVKHFEFENKITKVDFINNFFVAKTTTVKKLNGWDDDLKLSEHLEFFIRAKKNNVSVVFDKDFYIHHYREKNQVYNGFRERNYLPLALKKHDYKKLIATNLFWIKHADSEN